MKNTLTVLAGVLAVTQVPAMAGGVGNNTLGPSVRVGSGNSALGIDGKFGIANNLSLRPYVSFPTDATDFGASLTYDFDLRRTPITPFIGAGVGFASVNIPGTSSTTRGFAQIGADFNISRDFALLGSVNIPFSSGNSTNVTLGAGLRF
jgi:opacity protein-like surface antigen